MHHGEILHKFNKTEFPEGVAMFLDIDGTIDTADKQQLSRLVNIVKDLEIPIYINTARPGSYCRNPDRMTTRLAPISKHYCMHPDTLRDVDVPRSKVLNMKIIKAKSGVADSKCCILIDDQSYNEIGLDFFHSEYIKKKMSHQTKFRRKEFLC
mgnify:CR=1 FL=1